MAKKVWKSKVSHKRHLPTGKTVRVRTHNQRYSEQSTVSIPSVLQVMNAYKRLSPIQEIILSQRIIYIPINEMKPIERKRSLIIINEVSKINESAFIESMGKKIPNWKKVDFQITNDELELLLTKHYGKKYWNSKKTNEVGMLLFGHVKNKILKITNFEIITNDMFLSRNWRTERNRSAYEFDIDDITKTIIEQFEKGLFHVGELHTHPAYVGFVGGINPGDRFDNTASETDLEAWRSMVYPFNNVGGVINMHYNGSAFVVLYFKDKIVFSRWIRK